jgi:surface carbohydrate biosynthesis protein
LYKINLYKNKKIDLLLTDNNYANISFKNISSYNLNKEINIINLLRAFFFSLFKSKFSLASIKKNYYLFLIKSLSPKVVIGHDMNGQLLKIKKLFPQIKSVCYQLGNVWAGENKIYQKIFKNNKLDYFFVYDERARKIFSKMIKSKFIVAGSLKNNEIRINNFKKKYDIMYISQYRLGQKSSERARESEILRFLDSYCLKKNKKLLIALAYNKFRSKKHRHEKAELEFINQNCKKYFIEKKISSYASADMSKVIVCFLSNLGIELLAKNKKVLFFDLDNLYLNTYKKINSLYVLNNLNYQNFEKKIKLLISLSTKSWIKKIKKDKMSIKFDKDNLIFKKFVLKLIK